MRKTLSRLGYFRIKPFGLVWLARNHSTANSQIAKFDDIDFPINLEIFYSLLVKKLCLQLYLLCKPKI